jgi:hypothetical protein
MTECAEMRAQSGGRFMADDMEKNQQQSGQNTGNQSGQQDQRNKTGQTGETSQKKGVGQNNEEEDNENLDRQRRAS